MGSSLASNKRIPHVSTQDETEVNPFATTREGHPCKRGETRTIETNQFGPLQLSLCDLCGNVFVKSINDGKEIHSYYLQKDNEDLHTRVRREMGIE